MISSASSFRKIRSGVLNDHAPLITAIDIGPMLIRQKTNWTTLALIGGFALVQRNRITILVNEAVAASSIERDEAKKRLEESTNRLNQATERKERVEATLSFKRARVRCQLIQWTKLPLQRNFIRS